MNEFVPCNLFLIVLHILFACRDALFHLVHDALMNRVVAVPVNFRKIRFLIFRGVNQIIFGPENAYLLSMLYPSSYPILKYMDNGPISSPLADAERDEKAEELGKDGTDNTSPKRINVHDYASCFLSQSIHQYSVWLQDTVPL